MISRFKTAILSFALIILLSAELLRADLLLAVDFDINQAGIQSNAVVDTNNKTTAWIVLYLTGDTDLYGYQFSVRFNADRLSLDSKDDNPPTNVNGKQFVESFTNEHSVSGSGGGFANYIEINRFDGKILDPSNTLVITAADTSGGLVLGVLNFTLRGVGDDLLIMPGLFEPKTGIDAAPFDAFLGEISNVSFQGGTITAVPEPSSLLFVSAAAGLIWTMKRRFSVTRKLPKSAGQVA